MRILPKKEKSRRMGRPKVAEKQIHQRIAVYPETYEIFKRESQLAGVYMIEYLARLAEKIDKKK